MKESNRQRQEGEKDRITSASSNVISQSTSSTTTSDPRKVSRDMIPENVRPTTSFSSAPTMIKIAKAVCELSATAQQPRPPPTPTKTEHVRLLTIGVR
jgi:hypothetical protein